MPQEKSKIYLVSTEGTEASALQLAKKGLLNIYSNFSDVHVTNAIIPLPAPRRTDKAQYLTYDFRDDLADAKSALEADYVILVTGADIYAGDRWVYVLGEAFVNDGVAIVSYYRLRPRYFRQSETSGLAEEDYDTLFPDTVVHEMGHLVGYKHSSDTTSVMYFEAVSSGIRGENMRFSAAEAKELPRRFVKSSFFRNKDEVFSFLAAMLFLGVVFNILAKAKPRIISISFMSPTLPYIVTLLPADRKLETVIFAQFDPANMIIVFLLSVFYLSIVESRHHMISFIEAMSAISVGIIFLIGFERIDAMIIGYFLVLTFFALKYQDNARL